MKQKIFLLVLIFASIVEISGQIKVGKYYGESDFISFTSDSVQFKIVCNGGLIVDLYASGTYELLNGFLLIKTGEYSGMKSTLIKSRNQSDSIEIEVFDTEDKPIIGVSVILSNGSNTLFGTMTNKNGIALIEKMNTADKITLSLIGYDAYTFEYSDEYNYQIKLMDSEIIENQTVVFKVNSITNDSLKLTLLTTDFINQKNKERELNKLYRKSRKYSIGERILIKK
jgi:hypothetical protein